MLSIKILLPAWLVAIPESPLLYIVLFEITFKSEFAKYIPWSVFDDIVLFITSQSVKPPPQLKIP